MINLPFPIFSAENAFSSFKILNLSSARCQIHKNPASPYTAEPTSTSTTSQQTTISTTKHSGLMRLFNKDKTPRVKSQSSNARASSSSGFSSAKSEKSDSSISLNEMQASSKVKMITEKESKKVKSSGSPKTKNKLLVSKSSKKSGKKDSYQSVEHYTNTNITIVDSKGLTPKAIIPNLPKPQKPISNVEIKSQGKRIEKKSESITSLLSTSTSSSQLPTPKPVATVKGTTKPPLSSPQHSTNDQQSPNLPLKTSNIAQTSNNSVIMTDSINSSSTGIQSNSSDSSVIYTTNNNKTNEAAPDVWHSKIAATYPKNPIPNRKINAFIEESTVQQPVQNGINGNNKSSSVLPMRPLLRGYNNRVTLPRGMKTGQHAISEFCEDLRQQGYNSDSDSLMKPRARYSDVESGYLSEGGTSTTQFLCLLRNRSQLPTTIEEK